MNICSNCTNTCTHTFTSPATPSSTSTPEIQRKKSWIDKLASPFLPPMKPKPQSPSMHSTTLTTTTTTAALTALQAQTASPSSELPKPTVFDFKPHPTTLTPSPSGTPNNVLVTPDPSPTTSRKSPPPPPKITGPLNLARSWSNQSTPSIHLPKTKELPDNIRELWETLEKRTLATMQDATKSPKAQAYSPHIHRFTTIPLFEDTAVELDGQYLHANQVTSPSSSLFQTSEKIIAAQYPLENDNVRELFWGSILNEKCALIIDLTQRLETKKSIEQYQSNQRPYPYVYENDLIPYYPWKAKDRSNNSSQELPQDDDHQASLQNHRITYGKVTITCKKVQRVVAGQDDMGIEFCQYSVNDNTPGCNREGRINRIHVHNWKDHNPNDSLKQIFFLVDQLQQGTEKTTLVHCRAGMGRTGTIISLHFMCKRMREKRDVTLENMGNILIDLIYELRMQRGPIFVQTFEQFEQLFKCSIIKWREYQKDNSTPLVSPSQGDKESKDD